MAHSGPLWLPDWKSKELYPDPKRASLRQWSWEFLRRNPEYQRLWNKHVAPYVNELGEYRGKELIYPIFSEKFGIRNYPCPPELSNPYISFETDSIVGLDSIGNQPTQYMTTVAPNEFYYKFILDLPTRPQILRAKAFLNERQLFLKTTKEMIPQKSRRQRISLYRDYLRVLDALTTKANLASVAAVLFPRLSNTHPEYRGSSKVRDYRDAAIELRDSRYKFIPMNTKK